jgi:hypothetical protein
VCKTFFFFLKKIVLSQTLRDHYLCIDFWSYSNQENLMSDTEYNMGKAMHDAHIRINELELHVGEIRRWISKACGGIKPIPTEAQAAAKTKRSNNRKATRLRKRDQKLAQVEEQGG